MTNRRDTASDDRAAEDEVDVHSPRPRGKLLLAATGVVLIVGAILAGVLIGRESIPASSAASGTAEPPTTTLVTSGDLIATTNVQGTLHYAADGRLFAGPAGVLTMLPAPGTVIAPGGQLYRVNNAPVLLLRGDLPAWRSFESGMTDGDDVRQLEQNLAAFGLFPSAPDGKFTRETAASVKAWQKAAGVEQTGRLDRSAVHFAPGDIRVAQLTATLGADVGPGAELYQVTSTVKVVDLALRLADQQLAVVGAPIAIALPDGSETPGVIAAVGQPTEQVQEAGGPGEATSTFVVPVSITLDAPEAAAQFARASVTARFSTTLGADVLTAPVEALVAIDADSFALEVLTDASESATERVPVTLGAFSSGRVAVSGPGIEDGTPVVVPSS